MAKCSHCEDERVSRCSYADCPFEVEDAHRTIAVLKAENERLTKECGRLTVLVQDWKINCAHAERALAERAGGVKVKPLEWKPTKTLNRNDYHGSKPYVVEYISAGEFRYTLSANYQVGASWDARRGATTPISGGTCVSLDEAKAAAQADFERRILSALESAAPERTCATCHAVLADGPQPFATYAPDTRPAEQAVTALAGLDCALVLRDDAVSLWCKSSDDAQRAYSALEAALAK